MIDVFGFVKAGDTMSQLDVALREFTRSGHYYSRKNMEYIPYQNTMELVIMKWLDASPEVVQYFYENLNIPYLLGGVIHHYRPDFDIRFIDKTKELWECKRRLHMTEKNRAKIAAAEKYCEEHGYTAYRIKTMDMIREFMI